MSRHPDAAVAAVCLTAGKGGKNRRRGKNDSDDKRELIFKEDGEMMCLLQHSKGFDLPATLLQCHGNEGLSPSHQCSHSHANLCRAGNVTWCAPLFPMCAGQGEYPSLARGRAFVEQPGSCA